MGMNDTERLRRRKLERLAELMLEREFVLLHPNDQAVRILEEIELAQIEEFERWHEVERNMPREGKEE